MFRHICLIVIFVVLLTSTSTIAQISSGGEPVSFTKVARGDVQTITMPMVDVAAYLAEDQKEGKDVPFRFGAPNDVDYDLNNSGTWETLGDGTRLWRLKIISKGAYSLNLLYDQFWLPKGGKLFLYNSDRSSVIGAFTSSN